MSESSTPTVPLAQRSVEELDAFRAEQQAAYDALVARGLRLDLTRGKPATAQLALSDDLLSLPRDVRSPSGVDTRNYGGLEGLAEYLATKHPTFLTMDYPQHYENWLAPLLDQGYKRIGESADMTWFATKDLGKDKLEQLRVFIHDHPIPSRPDE